MEVQALKDTFIDGTYRYGPVFHENGSELKPGDVFEVADELIVNREVLRVLKPPQSGKVKFAKLPTADAPAPEFEIVDLRPKQLTKGATA